MTDLETLIAIEAIRRLKARYFRCLDTKDWEGLQTVFTPDAVIDTSEANSPHDAKGKPIIRNGVKPPPPDQEWIIKGTKRWIDKLAPILEDVATVHHGHMSEIDILSPTSARGIWAMEDVLRWPMDQRTLQGYGHYHETYRCADGDWRIASLKLTRLWIIIGP